ncbi:unnamed protein product [Pleuronectes platessa]|uniref:Glypican-3 n=1 Tax=Pleuronectes platessa TaxID=8262 RepID=A0A9N7TX56_PLEPL|nr:unnamed protein product [Pleuronectes platessa]
MPKEVERPKILGGKHYLAGVYVDREAFDLVLRHGRNSTLAMLKSEFPGLGAGAQSSVGQLFLDMALYILGSDSTVDHMVAVLYGRLFPLAYRRLLGGSVSAATEECIRGAWKDSAAFGPYPKLMMTRLSRSLLATRVFLQALNLGIEVVNTTDHLRPSRDCSRALLRLWYCPHCQGMLGPPACRGFCQAVMQGCLGGAAEVQPHWRTYVDGLGKLAGSMRGEQDMEAVVLRLPSMIKLALKHAVNARSRLTALSGRSSGCELVLITCCRIFKSVRVQTPVTVGDRRVHSISVKDSSSPLPIARFLHPVQLQRESTAVQRERDEEGGQEPRSSNLFPCQLPAPLPEFDVIHLLSEEKEGGRSGDKRDGEEREKKKDGEGEERAQGEGRTGECGADIHHPATPSAVNEDGKKVNGMCGQTPQRASRSVGAPPPAQPPAASAARSAQTSPSGDSDETLAGLRREFISNLRGFSSFYSGLGEALCSREPAPANHSLCWNGQEMTDRFPGPSLKRVHPGSESKSNKPPEPIISQIIDKLKHINQLLRLVTVSEKRWRARSRGGGVDGWSDDGDEGFQSGDCDDEDECTGVSGLGPPPRRKRLRIFAVRVVHMWLPGRGACVPRVGVRPRETCSGVADVRRCLDDEGIWVPTCPLWSTRASR